MTVECHFFGPLREAVGTKTVEYDIEQGATIGDVIGGLVDEYPELESGMLAEDGSLQNALNVTLNKENINHLDGPETVLEEGDVIRFASAVVGG